MSALAAAEAAVEASVEVQAEALAAADAVALASSPCLDFIKAGNAGVGLRKGFPTAGTGLGPIF